MTVPPQRLYAKHLWPKPLSCLCHPNISLVSAGLIESDGCMVIPYANRTPGGQRRYPSIEISFQDGALSDNVRADSLRALLGAGSIRLDSD